MIDDPTPARSTADDPSIGRCHRPSATLRGVGGALIAALLVVVPVGRPSAAQVAQDREERPVVRSVRIQGNRAFSDREIEAAIATRESGCRSILLSPLCLVGFKAFQEEARLQPRELGKDVVRIRVFYFRRGYRQASVDTAIAELDNGVRVTFLLDEGAPVRVASIVVEGLEGIRDSASIAAGLPLEVGDPFSEITLSLARSQIEERLRNQGYARAQVLVDAFLPAGDELSAQVSLRAVPGLRSRIGEVEVIGTQEVDPSAVKRLLTFRTGDLYREAEIVRSQRNLYSLALFEYVDIAADLAGEDSIIDVRVQVNEAAIRDARLGFGLTTAECVQLEAGWTHRNFLGDTRRLSVSGVLSNILTSSWTQRFPCTQAGDTAEAGEPFNKIDWRTRVEFQQPWFISSHNSLRLGFFADRQSLPKIYARRTFGADVTLAREIAPRTPLTLVYRAERDRILAGSAGLLFCANFGVCRPEDIAELEEPRWLASVGITISRNRTDVVFDPSRGYRLTLEGEHGSRYTGSEYAYYRGVGELSYYHDLGASTVLAVRLKGGWVSPIGTGIEGRPPGGGDVTHPLKRLYSGGAFTVRGYGQNLLGPKVLLVEPGVLPCDPGDVTGNTWECEPTELDSDVFDPRPVGGLKSVVSNIELRFPILGRWSGAVFVDVGQVWTRSEEVRGPGDLAFSPGLGIRYMSPVGPLRLDLGYNTGQTERLPVVTEVGDRVVQLVDASGTEFLFDYDPFEDRGLSGFLSRIHLNFSIGQAF